MATVKVQAHSVDSHTLWHSHLDHPSNTVLSLLPKSLGASSHCENKNFGPCDVCFRAKQTRRTFNVSESKVNDLFETINYNI